MASRLHNLLTRFSLGITMSFIMTVPAVAGVPARHGYRLAITNPAAAFEADADRREQLETARFLEMERHIAAAASVEMDPPTDPKLAKPVAIAAASPAGAAQAPVSLNGRPPPAVAATKPKPETRYLTGAVLRGATSGQAWIVPPKAPADAAPIEIAVGQSSPGLGRVLSISQNARGDWIVKTTIGWISSMSPKLKNHGGHT